MVFLLCRAEYAGYRLADEPLCAVEVAPAYGMTVAAGENQAVVLRGFAVHADDGGFGQWHPHLRFRSEPLPALFAVERERLMNGVIGREIAGRNPVSPALEVERIDGRAFPRGTLLEEAPVHAARVI